MVMSLRDRILAVYAGETPDVVPCMLDLSHWFYHNRKKPWDLSLAYEEPEYELIDYHKRAGIGFYVPNLAAFLTIEYEGDVSAEVVRESRSGRVEIAWRYVTPLGRIERRRVWNEDTYSWAISEWGVRTEQDARILAYAMSRRRFVPHWDRYEAWADYVGDCGLVYLPIGYSAVGHLLHYWMGVEGFTYAAADWPSTMREVVRGVNENNLQCIDAVAKSPAEVILMGDNFSSDVQPPHFFDEWSRAYYSEAIARLHRAGKYAAMHVDGRLKGALAMVKSAGADCADAVTPVPMGDLSPEECRLEAGTDLILSGGVSPDLWLPNAGVEEFKTAVLRWLDLKKYGPRLIASAGDQVPPGAVEDRISLFRDLVEEWGRFE